MESQPLLGDKRDAPAAPSAWHTAGIWVLGLALTANAAIASVRSQAGETPMPGAPGGSTPDPPFVGGPGVMATPTDAPGGYAAALWARDAANNLPVIPATPSEGISAGEVNMAPFAPPHFDCPAPPAGIPDKCLPPADAAVVKPYLDFFFPDTATSMHPYFPLRFEGAGVQSADVQVAGSSGGSAFFAQTALEEPGAIRNPPVGTYPASEGNFTMVMTDIDIIHTFPPDACTTAPALCNATAIHYIITNCQGESKVGDTLVAYNPPSPEYLGNNGAHRYMVVLFKGVITESKFLKNPVTSGSDSTDGLRANFDYKTFVEANAKSMTPIAYNYFWAS